MGESAGGQWPLQEQEAGSQIPREALWGLQPAGPKCGEGPGPEELAVTRAVSTRSPYTGDAHTDTHDQSPHAGTAWLVDPSAVGGLPSHVRTRPAHVLSGPGQVLSRTQTCSSSWAWAAPCQPKP